MRRLFAVGAALIALGLATSASAAMQSFDITWSGDAFGNGAVAHGTITVDTSALPEGSSAGFFPLPDSRVQSLTIKIQGAGPGNGKFTLADFSDMTFWTPAALDLTQELIGQDLGGGCTYGPPGGPNCGGGDTGDFNLAAPFAGHAPNGVDYFDLETHGGYHGDEMLVTSIRPHVAVPEPTTWAMTIFGLGLAGAALRRRREAVATA
jgi:hypothetical protein